MRKYCLFFLTLLCSYPSVFCQHDFRPGFIIKNNGDSVSGFVDFRGNRKNEKVCHFRETKKSKTQSYAPGEIKAFGFPDEKRYETFSRNEKPVVFAEKIISGNTSLYQYKRTFYLESSGAIIQLPKKEQAKVTTDKGTFNKISYPYIGTLNVMFADCGLNANEVRYEERDMTLIVQKYNDCKKSPSLAYKKNKPWSKTYFTILSGVDISNLSIDNINGENSPSVSFGKSISPIYGMGLDFSAPRVNEKWFISLEFSYLKKFYQAYHEMETNANLVDRNDYLIDVSFLKIPLGLRYNFLRDEQTPYFKFGISQYFVLNSDIQNITERENTETNVVTTYVQSYDKDRSQFGLWVAAGFNKTIGSLKYFAEFRYERANGFYGGLVHPNPTSKTQNITVVAGLRF